MKRQHVILFALVLVVSSLLLAPSAHARQTDRRGATPLPTAPVGVVLAAPLDLKVSAPTGTGSYAQGSTLTVAWAASSSVAVGEFGVWARSRSGGWYVGRLVAAGSSSSFSTPITLDVPAGSGYQAIVAWRATVGSGTWVSFATQKGSFAVTPPTLTVSAPTGRYAVGSSITVSWTSSPALAFGEFGVWARSATGWYAAKLATVGSGTSFSTPIALDVPPGSGYQAIVAWRPTVGSGTWVSFGTQTGSFAVTAAATPTLTITAPTGTGSYAVGSSLTVGWTTSSAAAGEFGVWARSATGWFVGKLVTPSGGSTFSTPITLNVPAGSGYRTIVSWRPTVGSGTWVSFGTSRGSFVVTEPVPTPTPTPTATPTATPSGGGAAGAVGLAGGNGANGQVTLS